MLIHSLDNSLSPTASSLLVKLIVQYIIQLTCSKQNIQKFVERLKIVAFVTAT